MAYDNIRVLDRDDADRYLELRLEALLQDPDAFGSTYEENMQNSLEELLHQYKQRLVPTEKSFTVGAFYEATLISAASILRQEMIKFNHKATLLAVYTSPDYRGKGIGKAVLYAVIEHAKKLEGLEQITLSVLKSNKSAKKLYESEEFKIFGSEKQAIKYKNRYQDELHMKLFL
ncbi:GNAT family N-acetyltransferase [Bacillus gobiensis]|uniref:GNAT family N-acetyltransferase n=1 Tax=Bacillus gobiensis TaxID=1441095 RepID=UPI003D235E70